MKDEKSERQGGNGIKVQQAFDPESALLGIITASVLD